jgi:hypothetical protein
MRPEVDRNHPSVALAIGRSGDDATLHVEVVEAAFRRGGVAARDDHLQHRRRRRRGDCRARRAPIEHRPQHAQPQQHHRHQRQAEAPPGASEDRARAGEKRHQFFSMPALSAAMLWRIILR